MKPLARDFSMTRLIGTRLIWLGVGLIAAASPSTSLAAQPEAGGPPASLPPDLVAKARDVHAYPTFCSIPPTPVGVRGPGAFRAAVVDTRVAGARLVSQTAPSTFSLGDTDAFAAAQREEAAPPPPMTAPSEADAEAFAKAARARATPPKRPR